MSGDNRPSFLAENNEDEREVGQGGAEGQPVSDAAAGEQEPVPAPQDAPKGTEGGEGAEAGEEAPEPAKEEPPQEKRGDVPLAALLDERERRQKLEAELKRYREQQEAASAKVPDPESDPKGYEAYRDQAIEQRIWQERTNTSRLIAAQQFGEDEVKAATDAFMAAAQANPHLAAEVRNNPHPYERVVKWHRQQKLLSEVGDDPEKWRQAERERLRKELEAEKAEAQPAEPAAPQSARKGIPRSIAAAPAAGSDSNQPAVSGFDQLFSG